MVHKGRTDGRKDTHTNGGMDGERDRRAEKCNIEVGVPLKKEIKKKTGINILGLAKLTF